MITIHAFDLKSHSQFYWSKLILAHGYNYVIMHKNVKLNLLSIRLRYILGPAAFEGLQGAKLLK